MSLLSEDVSLGCFFRRDVSFFCWCSDQKPSAYSGGGGRRHSSVKSTSCSLSHKTQKWSKKQLEVLCIYEHFTNTHTHKQKHIKESQTCADKRKPSTLTDMEALPRHISCLDKEEQIPKSNHLWTAVCKMCSLSQSYLKQIRTTLKSLSIANKQQKKGSKQWSDPKCPPF